MSTFLDICRDVRKECGVALSTLTLPTAVTGQVGQLANIVRWVRMVWDEIQGDQLWNWQWEEATVTILSATSSTAGTIPVTRYVKDSARIGERFLSFMPWESFRAVYPVPADGGTGQEPSAWSIKPNGAFAVDIKPAANVAITVERYALPVSMVLDSDTPAMPADLHPLIMWGAVMKYAGEEEAGVRNATAEREYQRLLNQLHKRCLPEIFMGGPLA